MTTKNKATLDEVKRFRGFMYGKSLDIIAKKGHDYNRMQQAEGDTLFNLRVCSLLGIVETTEQGILVRLSDKLMRLASLTAPGVDPANKEESVLDTIADIHNYVDYLGLIWYQRREDANRLQIDATEENILRHEYNAARNTNPLDFSPRPEPTNPSDIADVARSSIDPGKDTWDAPLRERTDRK